MSNENTYLSAIIERDTLKALQALKELEHKRYPACQVSLSSIVRYALREGLKAIEVNHAGENQKPITDKTIQAEDC